MQRIRAYRSDIVNTVQYLGMTWIIAQVKWGKIYKITVMAHGWIERDGGIEQYVNHHTYIANDMSVGIDFFVLRSCLVMWDIVPTDSRMEDLTGLLELNQSEEP